MSHSSQKSLNSRTALFSIILLDVILMVLYLIFAEQILQDLKTNSTLSTVLISSFAIVIPVTLIILIAIQFRILFLEKYKSGNTLKRKIVLFFFIIALISAIPQTLLSINFFNTALGNWFNTSVENSIHFGMEVATEMYNNKARRLSSLGKSSSLDRLLISLFHNREKSWEEIKLISPELSGIQFFTEDNEPYRFHGNEIVKLEKIRMIRRDSLLPKTVSSNTEILSYLKGLTIKGTLYYVIISYAIPQDFTEGAKQLTQNYEVMNQLSQHKRIMQLGVVIFYSFFSIPLFLLSVLASFYLAGEVTKPIENLEEAMHKISEGDYSFRILTKKNNEFSQLIHSFNRMIKEIERSRSKLKHKEQFSAWQEIARRLAHEIRNPLTPIKLSAQRVLSKKEASDLKQISEKSMNTIIHEVDRLNTLLTEFRDFARFPVLHLTRHNMKEIILQTVSLYSGSFPAILFNTENIDEKISVSADKEQISRALSNLILNAAHAMETKGEITFTLSSIMKEELKYIRLQVQDTGCGIPPELNSQIFKPYFTTKYDGSGLGLAIVHKIILDHRGKIWFESAAGEGTTFYIELPYKVEL